MRAEIFLVLQNIHPSPPYQANQDTPLYASCFFIWWQTLVSDSTQGLCSHLLTELASGSERSRTPMQQNTQPCAKTIRPGNVAQHPPQFLGAWRVGKEKKLGLGRPRLTDHSKQMRSLLSQGQLTLATLNCTSLRNLNCHSKSLRLPCLPDNMDITHWLPNSMDITALARATHRGALHGAGNRKSGAHLYNVKHNTAAPCFGWAASSKDGRSTHSHKEFTFDPKTQTAPPTQALSHSFCSGGKPHEASIPASSLKYVANSTR